MLKKQDPKLVSTNTPSMDVEKNAGAIEVQPEGSQAGESDKASHYLEGFRLHLLTVGLCLSIFLVNFEISIISTSLVSITDDLEQFSRSSWIITGYLLSYTAFMVILAKLSDYLGRKTVLIASVVVFVIFSGACGAAQTMEQLIIFRAFQGLGASGVYSLVMIVIFEMVRPEVYPRYTVYVTALFATSLCMGPLLGGLINKNTTWRWVFVLNVPAGALALLILFICIPNNFPYKGKRSQKLLSSYKKLDIVGAGSMLAGITLLIVGFEEASNFSPWKSARVLAPIVSSIPAWTTFLWNERTVTRKESKEPEPVFPWRFFTSKVMMGILVNAFLCGAVFTSCVIQIPLRFQAVNNESPWHAGVRLIPFGVATPVGGAFTAALCAKRRIPIIYMLFVASLLQVLGLVFMSRLTIEDLMWKGQYGLQFVTGFGCGISMGVVTLMTPYVIEKKDLATATSAVVQVRVLGGALILAIITAVMNSNLQRTLSQTLGDQQIAQIFRAVDAIEGLAEPGRTAVKESFLKGYNMQLRILIGIAAAEVPATLIMWQRDPVRIS